jgi:hypothetical protein
MDANASTFDGHAGLASAAGSTHALLCAVSRRPWLNPGGDWIDANGKPQGGKPFSRSVLGASPGPGAIEIDVTRAVKWIWTKKHWCALFLRATGPGVTAIVGALHPTRKPPRLTLRYSDGSVDVLECWYTASLRKSTAYTNAQEPGIDFDDVTPAVLEFFKSSSPSERVSANDRGIASASLWLPYLQVKSGSPSVEVYVVNPRLPDSLEPAAGLASGYPFDRGLVAHPAVCAAVSVTDDHVIGDVLDELHSGSADGPWLPDSRLYGNRSEAVFDPTLWTATPGEGEFAHVPKPSNAQRDAMLPRRVHTPKGSKLSGYVTRRHGSASQDAIRVVHSSDRIALSRGFTPLAPGLGALEILYGGGDVGNGQSTVVDVTGNTGLDLDLWFNERHIGRTIDAYMRMYVLLGDGWEARDGGDAWQFYAPSGKAEHIGKYPEELGANPRAVEWRRQDRMGKFIGGVQQLTSGHTAYRRYVDPLRRGGDQQEIAMAGGGYGASSGIHGYQGRWMFRQGYYKPGTPGPAVGGIALGMEFYDFNGSSGSTIPSQNFIGQDWDTSWESYATHVGGLGFLYPRKWYCIEMRWRMNALRPYSLPPVGTHWLEGGHSVDGFVEWWVDGIHAARTPLFAHRSSAAVVNWTLQRQAKVPFDTAARSPDMLRGITNVPPELFMGAASAIFNAYYGGRTFNDCNKFVYVNGIVCTSGSYVGPMAGVSRLHGGLG